MDSLDAVTVIYRLSDKKLKSILKIENIMQYNSHLVAVPFDSATVSGVDGEADLAGKICSAVLWKNAAFRGIK